MDERRAMRGKFAVVGVGESAGGGVIRDKSQNQIGVEALLNACNNAGISVKDIDGVFMTGSTPNIAAPSPTEFCDYIGIVPRYTHNGGGQAGPIGLVDHVVSALNAGGCSVAAMVLAESGRSRVGLPKPRGADASATIGGQFLNPYGMTIIAELALVARRYIDTYGKTMAGFAEFCVSTRKWASLNPRATFRDPITVEEVLNSAMISDPMTILMCCPVTDAASCAIFTTAERARDLKSKPIYVLGSGHSVEPMIPFKPDLINWESMRVAGKTAFDMAGTRKDEIDLHQAHDAFVPVPIMELEGVGMCKPGEGLDFIANGRTGPGGDYPMNTNGGGLSYTHSASSGLPSLVEAVQQLRGESGPRQVPDAKVGLLTYAVGGFSQGSALIVSSER